MAREHPQFLQSEIKSYLARDASTIETDLEIFRKKIIRTFMDTVDGGSPRHDYDSHLIREFNNKCDQLGQDNLKIIPNNAGFTYTGQEDGVPALPSSNPTNAITNPEFSGNRSQSTATPGGYPFLIENFNGHPVGAAENSMINQDVSGWYFHSPMHSNTSNYKSVIGGQLMSKEAYNLTSSGQLLGFGDLDQPRVLKIFGKGDLIDAPGNDIDYNTELSRLIFNGSPFNTPITMMGNHVDPAAPGKSDLQTGYWARYDVGFNFGGRAQYTPSIPGGTSKIHFGCYVKVESGDALRDLNFGGMYIRQSTGTYNTSGHHDFVDVLQVKGSGFTQNPSLIGTTNYVLNDSLSGCYNWGNGRHASFNTSPSTLFKQLETFPRKTSARVLDSKLQSEASDWVLLSGETPYISDKFNAVLYFGENHSYLNGDGVLAGAVLFASPFVYFS